MPSRFEVISGCRTCGHPDLEPVLSLGEMPLADALIPPERLGEPEPRYPLTVVFCPGCSLVQILETVPPTVLFGEEYPYYSSFSDQLLDHSRRNVEALIERKQLDGDSLVVELASNDGYLLQWFVEAGIPVLGIDPAPGPAAAAEARGVPTICDFFDPVLAEKLAEDGRVADVVVANNVLAHVPDQNRFLEAIATILAEDGWVVIEVPYVRDLVDRCEFDTIYHEHHCYFSVSALERLAGRHGLGQFRIEHHPIHGGSLRVFLSRGMAPERSVDEYLEAEARIGLTGAGYYTAFADRVAVLKERLLDLLGGLKEGGATIAGYGAAAKATTLLNYTGIGPETLAYVADRNVHKQGWYMPGVHVPIVGPERLVADPIDHLLILAWNFKDEIMRQQARFRAKGGRFVIPVPDPVVV